MEAEGGAGGLVEALALALQVAWQVLRGRMQTRPLRGAQGSQGILGAGWVRVGWAMALPMPSSRMAGMGPLWCAYA